MADKKNIELIANNSNEAIELKKALSKEGEVSHIYTGSSTPIVIDNGNCVVGSGNIRSFYSLCGKDYK